MMKRTKEIVREKLEVLEIMKINLIKELEKIESKSRKLEITGRMKERLEELGIKILKNEIKALEKIA